MFDTGKDYEVDHLDLGSLLVLLTLPLIGAVTAFQWRCCYPVGGSVDGVVASLVSHA